MNREDIKGRWAVLSWEQQYDDGRIALPMGKEVEGFIEYSDFGMLCVISKKHRDEFNTGGQWSADDVEKAAAYNSYLTYAGVYDVEGKTITHNVKYSLFPNWTGGDQCRYAELDGNILSLTTARLEAGTTEARISKLVFTRCSLVTAIQ
jgi:hypothetical protein